MVRTRRVILYGICVLLIWLCMLSWLWLQVGAVRPDPGSLGAVTWIGAFHWAEVVTVGRRDPFSVAYSTSASISALTLACTVAASLILGIPAVIVTGQLVQRHRLPQNRCDRCGYVLHGTGGGRCPECGTARVLEDVGIRAGKVPPAVFWRLLLAISLCLTGYTLHLVADWISILGIHGRLGGTPVLTGGGRWSAGLGLAAEVTWWMFWTWVVVATISYRIVLRRSARESQTA